MQIVWNDAFSIKHEKAKVLNLGVLSETQINKTIGAKLLFCHNSLERTKIPRPQTPASTKSDDHLLSRIPAATALPSLPSHQPELPYQARDLRRQQQYQDPVHHREE
ncbi:hypothetical protein OUZ56_024244 [Daphnia magna]|uniref:Uncharacterized protein n=1 Tax=Daphnia magna TaxID=35525 RepID=A0ABR0B130_9CRUS|nr:hypothetical protein OUZ56_024244 [Daphnia magna]